MYSCRFQASTDETVNNVTPEAAGSVMGAETPLPGVETNHVLHNETASCLAFAASRLVIAEPFQGGLRTSLITVAATVLRRINHKQAVRTRRGRSGSCDGLLRLSYVVSFETSFPKAHAFIRC